MFPFRQKKRRRHGWFKKKKKLKHQYINKNVVDFSLFRINDQSGTCQ